MAHPSNGTNRRPPSTTGHWEFRKIRKRPQGQQRGTPKASRWGRRSALPRREPLTIKVTYRGGPECWYEIHARGEIGRFPGYVCLHDAFQEIMLGAEYHIRRP